MYAVEHEECLRLLLSHLPPLDDFRGNRYDRYPLKQSVTRIEISIFQMPCLKAAKLGAAAAIAFLLEAGADPNMTISRMPGMNPVQEATSRGYNSIAKKILYVLAPLQSGEFILISYANKILIPYPNSRN
jgi:hypothetical protein